MICEVAAYYPFASLSVILWEMSLDQLLLLFNRAIGLKERDIIWLAREVSVRNGFCFAGKSYDAELARQKSRDRKALKLKDGMLSGDRDLDATTASIDDPDSMRRLFGKNIYRG